jgi:hypothetical protein
MALDVLRVRAIDANMHAVPGAMATFRTSGTTFMGARILLFLLGCHSSFPFLCGTPRWSVIRNQPDSPYEFLIACRPVENDEIKLVIEIETSQSGLRPVHLFGKWCTSATARYFIHDRKSCRPIPFHSQAAFVQICDPTSVEKQTRTSKPKQWQNIENSIRAVLPLPGSRITQYTLLWGSIYDFGYHGDKRQLLLDTVRQGLGLAALV